MYPTLPRTFLFLALSLAGYALSAQETFTDKGILFVRGTGSLDFSFAEDSPASLRLGMGYFLWNDLLFGADLSYQRIADEDEFRFVPFARYYWRQRFFGELSWHPGSSEQERDAFLEGGVGYIFPLNDFITVEPGLFYPFVDKGSASLRVFISLYF